MGLFTNPMTLDNAWTETKKQTNYIKVQHNMNRKAKRNCNHESEHVSMLSENKDNHPRKTT